ncbi:hypothetical protein AURDEDRAFT_174587 [Auricularia subglabra TFB-10046 SS5]|uniref:Uncharacterized protein n=1 Tax=Auricularia subglabra (strain TFB-10046 / SS5) TaxID=717982 RepID=J0LFW1_AURST|nr:hypothetical protein AURDEDRAFT_174587 [Auricularia subglabra TFB-10046 SS5]
MLDKDLSDLEEDQLQTQFGHLPANVLARLKDVRERIIDCKHIIERWQRNEIVTVSDLTRVIERGPGGWEPGMPGQPTVVQRVANSRVYGFGDFQRECLGRRGSHVTPLPFDTAAYDSATSLAIEMAWYYNALVELRKEGRSITSLPPVCIPRELLPDVGTLDRRSTGVLKGWMPYFRVVLSNGVKTQIIVGNWSVCPPMPPAQHQHRVLRYDGRFGPHEQQWVPQWDWDEAPYKAFIPLLAVRSLSSTTDSDSWYFRTHSDADLDIAFYRISDWMKDFLPVAPGLWMLGSVLCQSVMTGYLSARADWAFAIERRVAVQDITLEEMRLWDDMDHARDTVLMAADFLRNGRGTSFEIRLSLSDFQWAALDLRGWRIYCGALGQSHALVPTSGLSDEAVGEVLDKYRRVFLRGAFTTTREAADKYLAYNVPVWHVMPYDKAVWEELCKKEALGTAKYMRRLEYNGVSPECDGLELAPRRESVPAVAPYRRFLYSDAQLAEKATWAPRPGHLYPAFAMRSKDDEAIDVGGIHADNAVGDLPEDGSSLWPTTADSDADSPVGQQGLEHGEQYGNAKDAAVHPNVEDGTSTEEVGGGAETVRDDDLSEIRMRTPSPHGQELAGEEDEIEDADRHGVVSSREAASSPSAAHDFRAALLCYGSSDEDGGEPGASRGADDGGTSSAAGMTAQSYVTSFAREAVKRKVVLPGNTEPPSKRTRRFQTQKARVDAGLGDGSTNLHLVGEGGNRPLRWERGPAWLAAPPLRLLQALAGIDLTSARQVLATAGAHAVVPQYLFDSSTEGRSTLPPLSFFLRAFIGDDEHGRTTVEVVMRALYRWIMMRHYLLRKMVRLLKDKDGYSDWDEVVKALGLGVFDYREPERREDDGGEHAVDADSGSALTQFNRLSGFINISSAPNFNGIPLEPYVDGCTSWLSDEWRGYILYELGEMEFRHKLFQLDHLIRLSHPEHPAWRDESVVRRFNKVAACWGGGGLTVAVDDENWLVSNDFTKRTTALTHFSDLVREWPGAEGVPDREYIKRATEQVDAGLQTEELVEAEDKTWKAYMQAFWDYTRASPVLPLERPVFPGTV